MRPSLRGNVAWILAGNGIYALAQWAVLIVLARLGGASEVGRYALALAVTAPLIIFLNLSLRQIQATDAADRFRFRTYLDLRLLTSGLALLVAVALALTVFRHGLATVLIIIAVAKVTESLSDVCYGRQQRRERLDLVARSLALRGLTGLGMLLAAYSATSDLRWAVAALAVAWASVLVLHDLPRALAGDVAAAVTRPDGGSGPGPVARRRHLLALLRLAFPMGFAALFISLNANVPRYVIEHVMDERSLGIFAALAYLAVAGGMVMNSVEQALVPRLAVHHAAGRQDRFWRLQGRAVLVALALGLGGMLLAALAGRPLLARLYGEEFGSEHRLFLWIMLAGAVSYLATVMDHGMMARRLFGLLPWLFGVVVVVNLVGCTLLARGHGLVGVVWGWTLAMGLQLLAGIAANLIGGRMTRAATAGRSVS